MPSTSYKSARARASSQAWRPRVVIADDHAMVAAGLRRLLEDACEVLAVAADGDTLIRLADELHPDIVVTDISMPLRNGIEAVRAITARDAQIRAICLSMHADRTFVAEAFAAGAMGYVVKHAAAEELLDAIRNVARGRSHVSPTLAGDARYQRSGRSRRTALASAAKGVLTPRQRQVLQLLAEGHTQREVATRLRISQKTVEFHKGRIKEALGVSTGAQLIQYALKHGLAAE